MFQKVLIANRGEIACRIIRTLQHLQIASVAIYTDADADSLHVDLADEAYCIGESLVSESYLQGAKILEIAKRSGAEAIHPGYGFLSENAAFARACEREGIVFIGPRPEQMESFGLKHTARELAIQSGVPLLPGSGLLGDLLEAKGEAKRIGYPVMLKSTAGGGGIGMQLCSNEQELEESFLTVKRLSENHFANSGVFLEKYVSTARHIEVQVFGDGKGKVTILGDRDCSLQRRNQKVVEETPAPHLSQECRESLYACAKKLMESVSYLSAGTVEFIYDPLEQKFYFLEVNTRLQVEHGITEEVSGVDLVEWMVYQAYGLDPSSPITPQGHAIEVRLYAEDPAKNFQPSSGLLSEVRFPQGVRCDTFVRTGVEVSPYYDPMIAKLIVKGESREEAIEKLSQALQETKVEGIVTNLDYLLSITQSETFLKGAQSTRFLNDFVVEGRGIDILSPGAQTSVQDYPGREGYWDVGVPPSGAFDSLSFRYANALVGNHLEAAGLEMVMSGPTLRFNQEAIIALCGAEIQAELEGQIVPMNKAMLIPKGATLKLKKIQGAGLRAYLAIRGGIDVPLYLGSRSTFTLGRFGGHAGRNLVAGDRLKVASMMQGEARFEVCAPMRPWGELWEIGVLYGPHGAPDFFTNKDIERFFEAEWEVHFNSNRTGVRLIGPKPDWARRDGGEAGLHPSNIHDNAYAIGAVDFTGDMPVILGPDGPSLGGFVCPVSVVSAEWWKIGQLKAGDRVRFIPIAHEDALAMLDAQEEAIQNLAPYDERPFLRALAPTTPRLYEEEGEGELPALVVRQSGDAYLLVEYGEMTLDIARRFRVHLLMETLQKSQIQGIIDITPGIRSLQIHFNPKICDRGELIERLKRIERNLPSADEMEVPSRTLYLPLSWDDPATKAAIEKYMTTVRPDAPWCPSNIEFIRRINGLSSIEEVKRIVFEASYLVMGLGDVYLGAPVATPLDPRHRLITTKYNPARTWTPENAVGIGGAYMCVYGMEGPGGYQFVGRTVQMWNRYPKEGDFVEGKPWLLRFFDQIRFYEVSAEELLRLREEFPRGRVKLRVEEGSFSLRAYQAFLCEYQNSIEAFKRTQQSAFEEERLMWERTGLANFNAQVEALESESQESLDLPQGVVQVESPLQGNLWKILVQEGERVSEGQVVMISESMKMEIPIEASESGTVVKVLVKEGENLHAGKGLLLLEVENSKA